MMKKIVTVLSPLLFAGLVSLPNVVLSVPNSVSQQDVDAALNRAAARQSTRTEPQTNGASTSTQRHTDAVERAQRAIERQIRTNEEIIQNMRN